MPDAPNYRQSDEADETCRTCANADDGRCNRYDFDVTPTWVCDDWEMREGRTMFEKFVDAMADVVNRYLPKEYLDKLRQWDGSASNYDSTEQYCSACLIDVNSAAGRDTKAQSHCMLPVKAPGSDSYDFEGVQAAAGGRGITRVEKPDDVPQEDWDKAKKAAANTIIAQYNANDKTAPDSVYEVAGKSPPEERALSVMDVVMRIEPQLPEYAWVHDVFFDESGAPFVIYSDQGKLYRMAVSIEGDDVLAGTPQEVVIDFRPTGETRTSIIRQADGKYRWFSKSATAVLNRVGEIDSTALFDSFIAHAKETGEYPYRTFFHQGEKFRTGQADYLARDGFVYITSGLYDDNDLARAEIEARQREPDYYGESIGFRATAFPQFLEIYGVEIPVYTRGVNVEISTLPEHRAASWYTNTVQEVSRMKDEVREELLKMFGGDEARMSAFVASVDATNREIEDEELLTRAQDEVNDTDQELESETEDEELEDDDDTQTVELDGELLDDVAAIVEQSLSGQLSDVSATLEEVARQLETLTENLTALDRRVSQNASLSDERLRVLERTEDERVREIADDMPARSKIRMTYRPRHQDNGPDSEPSISQRAESIEWPR